MMYHFFQRITQMKKNHRPMFYSLAGFISALVIILLSSGFVRKSDDVYFEINRSIDLFGKIYKELAIHYVDELDPSDMLHAGIRGMLSSLDPYTVFIDEDDKGDVEMLTTGKYGGIGITVGIRDGKITITNVMEGYSAEREGLRVGDHILEIDGKNISGKQTDEVRSYMRGEPGTIVRLKIERPTVKEPFEISLKREEISLKNVSYTGILDNNIGYIRLDRFSRRAGEDVRESLKQLQTNLSLQGIILDLRDNPGGLLDAAVDVVEKFVPRGSMIVTTRGRKANSSRDYKSEEDPLIQNLPLVIIVNNNSASASEIVAGAIQDLDRGVLIGMRTFGKGLVQSVTPLSYNTSLKITTSRYYTPSGRCIQEIDYTKHDTSAYKISPPKDSTKKAFKTIKLARTVFEAGGITPDTLIEPDAQPKYVQELIKRGLLFEFVSKTIVFSAAAKAPHVNEEMLKELKTYLEKEKFEFRDETGKKLDEAFASASKEKYGDKILTSLKSLQKQLDVEHKNEFDLHKKEITQTLKIDLAGRFEGAKSRIQTSLEYDRQVSSALSILKNRTEYQRILIKPHE